MAASSPDTDSRKRPRGSPHDFSPESLRLESCECVYPSCNKDRGLDIIHCKVSPCAPSSSCAQPVCISFSSGMPFAKEDIGSSYSRSHESSAPVNSSASAVTDTADSTTGSAFVCPLPHECGGMEQELLGCAGSDEEVGSCCGGNDTSELDVTGFLLREVWDDEGGDAFAFDPETIFFNGGTSTNCSDDDMFTGCSAENGNWFLNDLDGEGYAYLNEVLDQEWMAAAAANLDRINDTLDADLIEKYPIFFRCTNSAENADNLFFFFVEFNTML